MVQAQIATQEEYLKARLALLEKEKALTREHDKIREQRRALPLVEVTKQYTFTTTDNKNVTLEDLFEGRRQLIVYHAMFAPEDEAGCPSCSFVLDHIPRLEHLNNSNTTFVAVSRAPAEKIKAYQKRMEWTDKFTWVSSNGSDFNYDFHATHDEDVAPIVANFRTTKELDDKGMGYGPGEVPGTSVFVRGNGAELGERGKFYHSYSTYTRGFESVLGTAMWLDLTPLGRQEGSPHGRMKRHDEYSAEDLAGK